MRIRLAVRMAVLLVVGPSAAHATMRTPRDPRTEPALVRLADLGPSWTQRSASEDDPDSAAPSFCGVRLGTPLSITSARFTNGVGMLDSYVGRFRPGEAKRIIGSLRAALSKGCVVEQDSGLEGEPAVSFTYRSRKVPLLADESIGLQSDPGALFTITSIIYRSGRNLMTVSYTSVGPAPKVDVDRIAGGAAKRL